MERRPNLADKNPEKVADLQQRIESLAREGGQPLLMKEVKGVAWHVLTGSVATPEEERDLECSRNASLPCQERAQGLDRCGLSSRYCVVKTMEKIPPGLVKGLGPHSKYRRAGLPSAD